MYICLTVSLQIVKLCVFVGSGGSISGSGRAAQMQVTEGKKGGGPVGRLGAHAWL